QQFQDNIDVAPASDLAQRLYRDQIDEIIFYDITASAEKRKIDLDTVRDVARHVFVPFTVGGGIRNIDDMYEVLKAGAEKISVDSMAVRNPDIIREGAEAFGRQCIVLSTQVKRVGVSASVAIVSSILYSPRLPRNLGVREIKEGLVARGVPVRPWLAERRQRESGYDTASS